MLWYSGCVKYTPTTKDVCMTTIIHNDCVRGLETLPPNSVDVIFIDPPYNTGVTQDKTPKYSRNEDYVKKNWKSFHADWDVIDDYYQWARSWLSESKRVLKEHGSIFICGSFHNIPDVAMALRSLNCYTIQWISWCIPNSFPNLSMTKMVSSNQVLIWARANSKHFYDAEAAKRYNDGKNLRDYWVIPNNTSENKGKVWLDHPSKKPTELVQRAIDIALPKEDNVHVVDFFAGSGTTGTVCKRLSQMYDIDINCTLIEREEQYVSWITERMQA